jgi:outer membrane protein assembly factor BamB
MVKIVRSELVLLFIILAFGCGTVTGEEGDVCGSGPLVSAELLKAAGLETLWETKLPMKELERLEQLHILGNRIYGLSDRNYMVSLHREKGNVIFSRNVAPAGLPVVGLELYKDELYSIIGGRLVELSTQFGTELSSDSLGFGVVCPVVRNSSYYYVCGSDRRLRALRAENKVKVFEVAAEDDSLITSVVADEGFVIFATEGGSVASISANGPQGLWEFEAAGSIAGPIVRDGASLFVSSRDTNIYRLNVRTGRLIWRYQAGALLETGPVVTGGIVYQVVDKGLVAIERGSGREIWELAGGASLLAEWQGRAYVITSVGELVVMDNKKGKRVYSVNFAGVTKYAANVSDSNIYIGDESGRLACLRPAK